MFWGTLYATLAVLPSMKARGQGHNVNITSIGGKVSVPRMLMVSVERATLCEPSSEFDLSTSASIFIPAGLEGMDFTQLKNGATAEIIACARCGGDMSRNPLLESDRHDGALMGYLYPRYRQAFAQKRSRF